LAEPVTLRRGLSKVLAPNPSVMTGPGTNTYLLGTGQIAVIDPGPDDAAHLESILAAATGRIAFVLVTHHHSDHAPLARALATRADAPLLGFGLEGRFEPDRPLQDGERLEIEGFSLQVLHTPGHASDHCCFLAAAASGATDEWRTPLLFTGDHVMSGSTVVIAPPDGDMTRYLESLRRVLEAAGDNFAIAPGHGDLIEQGPRKVESYLEHRLAREEMVAAALAKGSATAAELVPLIYQRLSPALARPAASSVWAHLRRLRELGRARSEDPDDLGARWEAL
jgi:glyoxylase-like metal-dependent hydrolase (beta-lactamase superfamily II)